MEDKLRVFAQRLRSLREEKNWTMQELADRINTSKSLISFYENAKREPGFTVILDLCKIFDETPDYIMGISEIRKNETK